ncbi:UDP-N-acetylglucosamine transferase subunit [Chamberlinius hualienensis]
MYIIVILLSLPVLLVFWNFKRKSAAKKDNISLMVVAGSGGHTAEILRLISSLSRLKYNPRVYVVAESDTSSEEKIHHLEKESDGNDQSFYELIKIPRSRHVGQSWLTTPFTTIWSTVSCIPIIINRKPDILLCNGPGTCIPLCLLSILFKMLLLVNTKVIYVESICRVYDLSLSAKILYKLTDHLIVQWPELQQKYPKTVYIGRLY